MFKRSKIHNQIVINWPKVIALSQKRAKDQRLKEFYSASLANRKLTLAEVEFVALDFETTGLNPLEDEIVSIGLVPFNTNKVYCRQASYWLVNPNQALGANSVVIHGITHSELDHAPRFQRVLGELLKALAGKMVVVHYNRIERDFLDRALRVRLGEGIRFPVIDTMAIEATLQRRRLGSLWKKLRGEKPISIRLTNSRERYGLPSYKSHHALTDAIATAELFQAQVAHHFSRTTTLEELWV